MTTDRFFVASTTNNGLVGWAVFERQPNLLVPRELPGTFSTARDLVRRRAAERNAMLADNLIPA